jgi:hypothetical protein
VAPRCIGAALPFGGISQIAGPLQPSAHVCIRNQFLGSSFGAIESQRVLEILKLLEHAAVLVHIQQDRFSPATRSDYKRGAASKVAGAPNPLDELMKLDPAGEIKAPIRSRNKLGQYPRFLREGGNLVKIGWSKSQRAEYEHKSPLLGLLAKSVGNSDNLRECECSKWGTFSRRLLNARVPRYINS